MAPARRVEGRPGRCAGCSVIYGILDLLGGYALSGSVHVLIYIALLTTAVRFTFQ